MSRHADGKTHLETACFAVTPLSTDTVREIYGTAMQTRHDEGAYLKSAVERLCLSHERLRAELEGMNTLLNDDRNEVRSVLQMLDELAELWGDEGKFRSCRDRLRKIAQ